MSSLLVIGNGFDLQLGAKTSYNDFFESSFYDATKKQICDWIRLWCLYDKTNQPFVMNAQHCQFSCWELLFYCVSTKGTFSLNPTGTRWCDVEKVIHDSLVKTIQWGGDTVFSWRSVNDLFLDKLSKTEAESSVRMMWAYIGYRHGYDRELFDVLLDELNEFEKRFGKYIKRETSTLEYQADADELVRLLCGGEDADFVDSFNYSSFFYKTVPSCSIENAINSAQTERKTRHINGNCYNPIFGIDMTEEEKRRYPECIRFTKTARRLQQDAHNQSPKVKDWPGSISRAIVFGHSLNRMDYDYFCYLLTVLRFYSFELDKMGSVEFVYCVYSADRADEIRSGIADAVYNVIDYYEGYTSGANRRVLANLLRFSGKLRIREIRVR